MVLKKSITALLVIFVVFSVGFALVKELKPAPEVNPNSPPPSSDMYPPDMVWDYTDVEESNAPVVFASENLKPDMLIVYYFHRSIRCTGCVNVEEAAFEAVSEDHSDDVDRGVLEWRSIDIDEPENKHFEIEFNLFYQELLFVEMHNNSVAKFESIAKVWQHWNNKTRARNVVNELIDEWLGGIEGR